jgi:ankyrin repeat protein
MAAAGLKEGNGRDSDRRGLILIDGGKLPDEARIVEAVTVVLLEPLDIDAGNRNGDTALHAASTMGYDRVVKLLAEKGANLNVKNSRGLTPLAALRGRNNSSTAELLRKLGAVE